RLPLVRHAPIDFGSKVPQRVAHLDRIRCVGIESTQRLWQARKLTRRSRPNLVERRAWLETLASLHDQFDQRLAGAIVLLNGEDVAPPPAVRLEAAPYLLAARPGGFAGRALAPRHPGVFLELVGAIEPRRVGRGCQTAADAEPVNRRARSQHSRNRILIDAAAGEDGHVGEPALVEDAPYLLGERDEVAAVETHAAHRDTRGFKAGP